MRFKLFEEYNEPEIGDWVVCQIGEKDDMDFDFSTFANVVDGKIGKIKNISKHHGDVFYSIYYENYPKDLHYDFGNPPVFDRNDIIFFSKSKEDCKMFLQTKKYNL